MKQEEPIIGDVDWIHTKEHSTLFHVDAIAWDIKRGIVTCLKYGDEYYEIVKDTVFTIDKDPVVPEKVSVPKTVYVVRPHKRYTNKIDHWITKNNIQSFTKGDFFKANPNCLTDYRFNHYVSLMVTDGSLVQVGKDSFKVMKKQKG